MEFVEFENKLKIMLNLNHKVKHIITQNTYSLIYHSYFQQAKHIHVDFKPITITQLLPYYCIHYDDNITITCKHHKEVKLI
jgi:hypothetical protein